MTTVAPWHKRTIKRLAALALLVVAAVLFVMSPFYARAILWGLNKIPVTVNQVAAASQQGDGRIEETEQPEPGSPEWQQQQQRIANEQAQRLLKEFEQQKTSMSNNQSTAKDANTAATKNATNTDLKQEASTQQDVPSLAETLARLQDDYQSQKAESPKHLTHVQQKKTGNNNAHVIVVLGGGLGRDAARNIVVNSYTRLRLEKAISQKQHNPLPILLSGVEAPYMQNWLKLHQVDARLLEDRSMNTCENTRFSALLLQKKGGAPRVQLVTDAYHMPRARRLFAMNGIDTIPVVAPLPNLQTHWQPSKNNLMHSRRATYEAIASIRDLWFGETNCREVP